MNSDVTKQKEFSTYTIQLHAKVNYMDYLLTRMYPMLYSIFR